MRRVHGEATECDVFIGRQRNAWEPTGLDGTCNGNEAWHTAQRRKRTFYVRNGVLLIGRGVAYRKIEETDLCWSATVETGVLFIGRGVAYRKTGLHGILFIYTVDRLHGLLFIHCRPPPASTYDCSSMGSCSSSLHRALLHRLLFN